MGEYYKVYSDYDGWDCLAYDVPTLENAYLIIKKDNLIGLTHYIIVEHNVELNMDSNVIYIDNEQQLLDLGKEMGYDGRESKRLCKKRK